MPKVVIHFDPEHHEYEVYLYDKDMVINPEYQAVMDMKSSHYQNILRNQRRYERDRRSIGELFLEAQMAGRAIREL